MFISHTHPHSPKETGPPAGSPRETVETMDTTRTRKDWDPADIACALKKTQRRWSQRALSLSSGYSENAVSITLWKPWPAVEAIIAREIGVHPAQIWPSRYNKDGTPKRGTAHPLTSGRRGHVYKSHAA